MDVAFVRKHGVFGKSRPRDDLVRPGKAYYGSRKSGKYGRFYYKVSVNAFRGELELRSPFLRAHQITTIEDLLQFSFSLVPKHIRFVRMDWKRLRRHLRSKFSRRNGDAIFANAKRRAYSIHKLCRFLRKRGVRNVHRFLIPLKLNAALRRALSEWEHRMSRSLRRYAT